MIQKLRTQLTYSNVIATLALCLAVSGGTAWALQGRNTVFSDDIVNGEVNGNDVRESSLAKVPNANNLDGLDSKDFPHSRRFNITLDFGQTKTLVKAGPLKVTATCLEDQGGSDELRLRVATSQNGAVFTSGEDAKNGGLTNDDFLRTDTPVDEREVSVMDIPTGEPYADASDEGAGYGTLAAAPGGARVLISDGDLIAGLNIFGSDCFVSGYANVMP